MIDELLFEWINKISQTHSIHLSPSIVTHLFLCRSLFLSVSLSHPSLSLPTPTLSLSSSLTISSTLSLSHFLPHSFAHSPTLVYPPSPSSFSVFLSSSSFRFCPHKVPSIIQRAVAPKYSPRESKGMAGRSAWLLHHACTQAPAPPPLPERGAEAWAISGHTHP